MRHFVGTERRGDDLLKLEVKMAWADIGKTEKEYVNDVLDSGWISRHKYIPRFEEEVARIHGQQFGMMTNSGTDALRIGLATLKEVHGWSDGDEVIVPSVTFVATVNAVIQNGLRPVFVDVDRLTYNLDPTLISAKISPKTRALVVVHLFGLPADMGAVMPIARANNLKVIEDSCETFGVHKIQGDMAAFSFYMAHMIQTGVGGVLSTNSAQYDKINRSYMNHGRSDNPHRFEFERVGYSSRATEMEAALGCAQIERYQEIIEKRQEIAKKIFKRLDRCTEVQMPVPFEENSYMLYPMVIYPNRGDRDELMAFLHELGIESRQMMPLLNQPVYKDLADENDYPVAKWINRNGICLPCHQYLTDEQINYMTDKVKGYFGCLVGGYLE